MRRVLAIEHVGVGVGNHPVGDVELGCLRGQLGTTVIQELQDSGIRTPVVRVRIAEVVILW